MPRSSRSTEARCTSERGSASLEFLTVGMILLVSLVYLVLAVAAIQAGAFGVEGAARQAARIAAQQAATGEGGDGGATGAVDRAVRIALADYGVDAGSATVTLSCSGDCTQPGSRVTARVRAAVALPLMPEVLAITPIASVPLEASATQTVSRFGVGAP
ncbi:hypothetical protein EDM22_12220 [Agromyces tardus]|uniref:Pilus assembly protein n=2 Tax=Agromyces tardus TaxID=2583849 RepID=A0A3M8A8N1_9MICO|nr:hypothetical protein EDM22_12220 [Agromyces tardus]